MSIENKSKAAKMALVSAEMSMEAAGLDSVEITQAWATACAISMGAMSKSQFLEFMGHVFDAAAESEVDVSSGKLPH